MNSGLVEQFEKKYTSLSGHPHRAESAGELAAVVLDIVRETAGRRVALGELPPDVEKAIVTACSNANIEVLKPPYDNRTLPHAIDGAQIGVSWAAFAVAESGSLIELTTNDATRLVSTLPRIHVGIFFAEDLLPTLKSAAVPLRAFFEAHPHHATATFISGPSRTADIEMRLTLGVHGPEVAHAVVFTQKKEG